MMGTFLISVHLFGAPGWTEMIVILGAVFLLFGATRLPSLGKGIGQGIRNFKSGLSGKEKGPAREPSSAAGMTDSKPAKVVSGE